MPLALLSVVWLLDDRTVILTDPEQLLLVSDSPATASTQKPR